MKWLKNLENIAERRGPGQCPNCGSSDTDYGFVRVTAEYGHGCVWCNDCKHAIHISRTKIMDGHKILEDLPPHLIF